MRKKFSVKTDLIRVPFDLKDITIKAVLKYDKNRKRKPKLKVVFGEEEEDGIVK